MTQKPTYNHNPQPHPPSTNSNRIYRQPPTISSTHNLETHLSDDPKWDIDPEDDSCPRDVEDEEQCEHLAAEHKRVVALKKEELRQRIKHAKMAEKIRGNIRECLPQDDCNSSSNNDTEVLTLNRFVL